MMMIRYLGGVAAIAFFTAVPASAQLLGGGGLGGQVGGLGGQIGGLGGSLGGTVDRLPTTDTTGQLRERTHVDRHVDPRQGTASVAGSTGLEGSVASTTSAATRSFTTRGGASAGAQGSLAVDARSLPTRGVIAAERRGLQRVTQTAQGVPVFVARTLAAPIAVVRAVPTPYPVYTRGAYYGGSELYIAGDVGGYMDRQYRDLRRGVQGTGATVFRRGDDLVVQLPGDVTFAFDKANIRPRFVGTLNAVAHILDDYRGTDVEITGHTDSIGSDQYNLGLSERRGRSVADFLVAENTDPHRMVVEALGESEPIATNATAAGRAANRRVEIILHPRAG